MTHMIQRSWSNGAAAAGQDPCVPHPPEVYFNSLPVLDSVSYQPRGMPFTTLGVNIPVGQSKTIDVDLFSTGPTAGPWKVSVDDYGYVATGAVPHLGLSLDRNTGVNGDVLHLTITVKSVDSSIGGEAFVIFSDLAGESQMTFGLVTN
jgi:hypothetical protein